MRRALTFFVLLLLAVYVLCEVREHSFANASDGGEEFVAGEVVVKLASLNDLPAIATNNTQRLKM